MTASTLAASAGPLTWPHRHPTDDEVALRRRWHHLHFFPYTDVTPEGFGRRDLNPDLAVPVWDRWTEWLKTLQPNRDGGSNKRRIDGSLAFTLAGNFPLVAKPQPPFGSRILFNDSGTIYGTVSLFPEDRGVGAELRNDLGLNPAGFVSALRVRHKYRGKRLSSYMMLMIDLIIQHHVNATGVEEDWFLFTDEPKVERICGWLGYVLFRKDYPIKAYDGSHENIYRKHYAPVLPRAAQ